MPVLSDITNLLLSQVGDVLSISHFVPDHTRTSHSGSYIAN